MQKDILFSISLESQGCKRNISVVIDKNKQILTLSDSESEEVQVHFQTEKHCWQNGLLAMLSVAKQNIILTLNGETDVKMNMTFNISISMDSSQCHIKPAMQRQEDAFCEISLNGSGKYNKIYNVNEKWAHISATNFFFSGIENSLEWDIFGE